MADQTVCTLSHDDLRRLRSAFGYSIARTTPPGQDDRIAAWLDAMIADAQTRADQRSIDARIEVEAQRIYETWSDQEGYVPWVPGGNSDRQYDARSQARLAFSRADAGTASTPDTVASVDLDGSARRETVDEPVAYLKRWRVSTGEQLQRVDLEPACEPWLIDKNPTIIPLYVPPPSPYTPTVGQDARTRDGHRVTIQSVSHDFETLYGRLGERQIVWQIDGKYLVDREPHPLDLVGPWVEPVQAAPEAGVVDDGLSVQRERLATAKRQIDWALCRNPVGRTPLEIMALVFENPMMEAFCKAALAASPQPQPAKPDAPTEPGPYVAVAYTNWEGRFAIRNIAPIRIFWGSNEWHTEPKWLIEAWDFEKSAIRTFALSAIGFPAPKPDAPRQFTDEEVERACAEFYGKNWLDILSEETRSLRRRDMRPALETLNQGERA